jgi:subfamily B ATP-binding cassette protein MsbA
MNDPPTTDETLQALLAAPAYRPVTTALIVLLSFLTTLLEGVGVGFLLPVIEYARTDGAVPAEGNALVSGFVRAYEFLGVPFSLEFLMAGVASVMALRIVIGFVVSWLSLRVRLQYVEKLQTEAFEGTLGARMGYIDCRGSDELLNELVTRVHYADAVFNGAVGLVQQGLLVVMYFAVAFYLAPTLTVASTVLFALLALAVRAVSEPAGAIGDVVATAHEDVQRTAQAGVQGVRDVKLFRLADELVGDFRSEVGRYVDSTVRLGRNQAAMESGYTFVAMLLVFGMLYVGIEQAALSLAELGVFVFVVYRLAPQINGLNGLAYQLEGSLPHVVRTRRFLDDLDRYRSPDGGTDPVPSPVDRVAFEDVSFAYGDDRVVDGVSFSVDRGEFVAFVGPSGAGKSTIAALLARLYDPDDGRVLADGTPVDRFDVDEWRDRVAVVPQDPHIFNESLRYNVTVGAREATDRDVDRACEAAQVSEFLESLEDGYDTRLGDDGARLSGGQRRRVAIARALLREADVLVLDEATGDLDSDLEERVLGAIRSFERELAVFVITHRLAAVADADRIYAVEDGRITEVGDHQELLANDGTYSALYAAQTRGQ